MAALCAKVPSSFILPLSLLVCFAKTGEIEFVILVDHFFEEKVFPWRN
jgi:hypothetical protein